MGGRFELYHSGKERITEKSQLGLDSDEDKIFIGKAGAIRKGRIISQWAFLVQRVVKFIRKEVVK